MLKSIQIFIYIFLIQKTFQAVIKETEHQTKQRLLPAVEVLIGASGFLSGFLLESNETKWKANPNYAPAFYDIIKNKKLKELELLMVYMKTYTKDITNKCKIAMKKEHKENEHYNNLILRCQLWGKFVLKSLPTTIYFFKPKYALRNFFTLIKSGVIQLEELDEDQDLKETLNTIFFDTLTLEIAMSKIKTENHYVDFNLILGFYGNNFKNIFDDILIHKKILRIPKLMKSEERAIFDKFLNVSPEAAEKEEERLIKEMKVEPVDGFEETTYKNLYRYYKIGWLEPLFNFNSMLKYF
jgi:hypothetical protein